MTANQKQQKRVAKRRRHQRISRYLYTRSLNMPEAASLNEKNAEEEVKSE